MIPQQTFETYPLFGANATKVEPEDAKKAAGFQQADVLPAEWMNWAWNKNSKGISDLNRGLTSVEQEILSVLTEYNITPAEATTDQLLSALKKIVPQNCSCSTAAGTAAKSVSLSGNVLKAGNIYIIEMTNGNTAASPTLSINSGTAYPMCDARGVALKSGAWADGDFVTVIFTGAKYLMLTLSEDAIERGNLKAVTSNAVACIIAANTTVTGPRLGTGGNIKIMFTADITGSDTTTPLSISYNGTSYAVKVCKNGAKAGVFAHEVATDTYKFLQAYTTLELVYDGTDLVIVGNPVVLSGIDYTFYADGSEKEDTPIGTTAGYQGTTDPAGGKWFLTDGRDTTGTSIELSTHYQKLYALLGNSNVLPEIFDHSRLGELEIFDESLIGNTEGTAWIAPYDGILNCSINTAGQSGVHYFYARHNGTSNAYAVNAGSGGMSSGIIEFKKGDKIWYTAKSSQCYFEVRYYKQHKIIKAL